jgi:MHS family proline/betaine transporter-like MFS transporter
MQMYKNRSKLLFAGIVGNLLEWFDFAIYGFFALTIGKVFFPKEDPVAQVIAAFGVFAIGFLMRPIGGLLLGYIGDKYGRQKAMLISVAAMAIPTFFVGILPGYETLGLAAPILLLLLRMIQGLSVGGEYTTSIVYMLEHTEPRRRGFVGAFAVSGAVGGILLGSAFGAFLASTLSPEALQEWGWRVPFLMGLILGLAGLYLRREPTAQGAPVVRSSNPLSDSLRFHRRVMLQISGLTMMNAVAFYMIFFLCI